MLTSEICPDVRFAYPEGAYTLVYEYANVTNTPVRVWDILPHNFEPTFPLLGMTDYVAYTVLPEHFTSEEY